jgi:hypothetical protein
VAFVAATVKVEEAPLVIETGMAVIVTVGAGLVTAVIVTVAVAEVTSPAPTAVAV